MPFIKELTLALIIGDRWEAGILGADGDHLGGLVRVFSFCVLP